MRKPRSRGPVVAERLRVLRPGQVAGEPEPDHQLRPALRRHDQPQADQDDPGAAGVLGRRARHHRRGTAPGSPGDWSQWGPRLGLAYSFNVGSKPAVFRANWGLYYAQTPTIFMTVPRGAGETGVNFCFFNPACLPPGGYPNLNPDSIPVAPGGGVFDSNYDDPALRNPRVMNTTGHLRAEPVAELHRHGDLRVREVGFPPHRGLQQHAVEPQLRQGGRRPVRAGHSRGQARPDHRGGPGPRQLQPGQLPPGRGQPHPPLRERLPVLRQLRVVAEQGQRGQRARHGHLLRSAGSLRHRAGLRAQRPRHPASVQGRLHGRDRAGLPARRAVHRAQRRSLPRLHPAGHERRRRRQQRVQQRPPGRGRNVPARALPRAAAGLLPAGSSAQQGVRDGEPELRRAPRGALQRAQQRQPLLQPEHLGGGAGVLDRVPQPGDCFAAGGCGAKRVPRTAPSTRSHRGARPSPCSSGRGCGSEQSTFLPDHDGERGGAPHRAMPSRDAGGAPP